MSLNTNLLNRYLSLINKSRVLAGKELLISKELRRYFAKQLIASITIAILTYYLISYVIKLPYLYSITFTTLSLLASFLAPPLAYYIKAIERAHKLELDFKYFVISEGIVLDKRSELLRDLLEVSTWKDVFPDLYREALRLKKLSKMLSIFDAVKAYIKLIKSKEVGRALLDYLFTLSLGGGINWVKEKSDEWLNHIKLLTYSRIRLRTTISVMLAILLGYTPPLVIMLSVIMGSQIIQKALTTTLILSLLAFIVTPRLPRHLSTSSVRLSKEYLLISLIPIISSLMAYLLTSSLTNALMTFSAVGIVSGVIKLRGYLTTLKELGDLPRILALMSEAPLTIVNPLEIFKKALKSSKSKTLKNLGNYVGKDLNTTLRLLRNSLWLSKYLIYIIIKGINAGTLSRERILKLRELILDLIKDIKYALLTNLIVAVIALALPMILSSVSTIAVTGSNHLLYNIITNFNIASIVLYGIYAAYVIFDDPLNMLFSSSSLLMYLISSKVI